MKRIALSFLMAVVALSSWAEDINAMMLHLASGKQVICLLDEKPIVTFSGDELVLTTHMSEVSYQSADVLKFTYLCVDPVSVNEVGVQQSMFSFVGNSLAVSGAEPDSQIAVYSVDGALVASTKTNKKGAASIVLPEQSGKVYVVKTSVANFKITRP